jgi:histidine triad (HIT) family protein
MKMTDCIFCKIINKEIPSEILYETDNVIAFKDIHPVAPVHVLIAPKLHIENIEKLDSENISVVCDIHLAAKKIANDFGISEKGYRLISNCGKAAGQTVPHLHYHLIGGKRFGISIV